MSDNRCKFKNGQWNCGSYQFNLHQDGVDQGDLCDVHYWQTKAERKPLEALEYASTEWAMEALAQEHAMHDLARLGQEIEQEKRGSIALARSLCYEIAGATSEDDMDGGGYGSVDIAEILSAEVVRLQAALAQPEQQAEPVMINGLTEAETNATASVVGLTKQAEPPPEWPLIKNILAVFGLDAIAFVAAWKAAQQQAEPVAREGFNVWWDGDYDDSDNRFEKDSAAYWAWAGWQAAQRKELSASEILNMMPSAIPAEYDGPLMEFARAIEAALNMKKQP